MTGTLKDLQLRVVARIAFSWQILLVLIPQEDTPAIVWQSPKWADGSRNAAPMPSIWLRFGRDAAHIAI